MAVKTKKVGASGRFGVGYGKVKEKLIAVERLQRIRQKCPFCRGKAIRWEKGIWDCLKCRRKFASNVFHL
jgi:ribosomal protein L37AE/L43A